MKLSITLLGVAILALGFTMQPCEVSSLDEGQLADKRKEVRSVEILTDQLADKRKEVRSVEILTDQLADKRKEVRSVEILTDQLADKRKEVRSVEILTDQLADKRKEVRQRRDSDGSASRQAQGSSQRRDSDGSASLTSAAPQRVSFRDSAVSCGRPPIGVYINSISGEEYTPLLRIQGQATILYNLRRASCLGATFVDTALSRCLSATTMPSAASMASRRAPPFATSSVTHPAHPSHSRPAPSPSSRSSLFSSGPSGTSPSSWPAAPSSSTFRASA